MRPCILSLCAVVMAASPARADEQAPTPVHWSASVNASTGGVVNGLYFNGKPQYGLNISARRGNLYANGSLKTVHSGLGTDSEDRLAVGYNQKFDHFTLRYQATFKAYPGTRDGFNDTGLDYGLTASKAIAGTNYALGVDYGGEDYATVDKSYGVNASISRGLLPKLSGWLSISHRKQWGSVDFTNTNLGLYYQVTSKIGFSTSINNWRAHADWGADRPTFSLSLSRSL